MFTKGQAIEARYKGRSTYYSGIILNVNDDNTYDVNYNDGEQELNVPFELIRLVEKEDPVSTVNSVNDHEEIDPESLLPDVDRLNTSKFSVGDRVEARYKGRSTYYSGIILNVNDDNTYDVNYNDGEQELNVPFELIRLVEKEDPVSTVNSENDHEENDHEEDISVSSSNEQSKMDPRGDDIAEEVFMQNSSVSVSLSEYNTDDKPSSKMAGLSNKKTIPKWLKLVDKNNKSPAFSYSKLSIEYLTNYSLCTLDFKIHSAIFRHQNLEISNSKQVSANLCFTPQLGGSNTNKSNIKSNEGSIVKKMNEINEYYHEASYEFKSRKFSFSMSYGDVRSKIFHQGEYPIFKIEVMFNSLKYLGEFYLPALSCIEEGLFVLDLNCSNSSDSNDAPSCSIVLEVFPIINKAINTTVSRRSNFIVELLGIIDVPKNLEITTIDLSVNFMNWRHRIQFETNSYPNFIQILSSSLPFTSHISDIDILNIELSCLLDADQVIAKIKLPLFLIRQNTGSTLPSVLPIILSNNKSVNWKLVCRFNYKVLPNSLSNQFLITPQQPQENNNNLSLKDSFQSLPLMYESKDQMIESSLSVVSSREFLGSKTDVESIALPPETSKSIVLPPPVAPSTAIRGIYHLSVHSLSMGLEDYLENEYSLEVHSKPDDVKYSSDFFKVSEINKFLFVLINKVFKFDVIYNSNQRKVNQIKISVLYRKSKISKQKMFAGSIVFDTFSMLSNPNGPFSLYIPLSNESKISILFCGLYTPAYSTKDSSDEINSIQKKLALTWETILDNTYFKSTVIQENSKLHISLGNIKYDNSMYENILISVTTSLDNYENSQRAYYSNNSNSWSNSFTFFAQAQCVRFDFISKSNETEILKGSFTLFIPNYGKLTKGMPIFTEVPLGDSNLIKIASLSIGYHISSLQSYSNNDQQKLSEKSITDSYLEVNIQEGSFDKNERVTIEPIFELLLYPPRELESKFTSIPIKVSSKYIPNSLTSPSPWNIKCYLPLGDNRFYSADSFESSGENWVLQIICKNSLSYGSPEIASTKIPISLGKDFKNNNMGFVCDLIPSHPGINGCKMNISLSIRNPFTLQDSTSYDANDTSSLSLGKVFVWITDIKRKISSHTEISKINIELEKTTKIESFHNLPIQNQNSISFPVSESFGSVKVVIETNNPIDPSLQFDFATYQSILFKNPDIFSNAYERPLFSKSVDKLSNIGTVKLSSIFVPYVEGDLQVHMSDFAILNKLSPETNYSFRLYLQNSQISFSKEFKPCELKNGSIRFDTISINTFEMISENEPYPNLDLKLTLISQDQSSIVSSSYVIPCHTLFYNSLKKYSSSNASSNCDGFMSSVNQAIIFADESTNFSLASLNVNISFQFRSVSNSLIKSMNSQKNSTRNSGIPDILDHELKLKELFCLVDSENDAEISLIKFQNILKRLSSFINAPEDKYKSMNSEVQLFNSPKELMSCLVNYIFNISSAGEPMNVTDNLVEQVFNQIDLSGDGIISWWEWKQYIETKMSSNSFDNGDTSPPSPDPLYITIQAAATSAKAQPFAVSNTTENNLLQPSDDLITLSSDVQNIPLPKAVSKLKNIIKSLKATNSILKQKLENALLESQNIKFIEKSNTPIVSALGSISQDYSNNESIENPSVSNKIKSIRDENTYIKLSLDNQRKKYESVLLDLNLTKSRLKLMETNRTLKETESRQLIDKIQSIRYSRLLNRSRIKIVKQFLNICLPKFRRIIYSKKLRKLFDLMSKLVKVYKERKLHLLKKSSSIKLQSYWRGHLCRKTIRIITSKCFLIQKVFRGFISRKRVKALKQSIILTKQVKAATKVQAYVRRFLQISRTKKIRAVNASRIKIQRFINSSKKFKRMIVVKKIKSLALEISNEILSKSIVMK